MENPSTENRRKIWGLHPNIFFLGMSSLLTDVSSEMIFTLVPLFLTNVLGAATTVVGLVGGLSESTDAAFRILSGWVSDRLGKRKLLAVLGYGTSTLAKPFMYLAGSWGAVTLIRFADRAGKGIRTAPRDALLASSLGKGERGRGFGIHRAMDTFGAFLGLGIAAIIIYIVQGGGLELSLSAYRWLVVVGVVPAILGVLVLLVFVHEARKESSSASREISDRPKFSFDSRFKIFLAIMAVFTLGKPSEFFLILRAQNLGSSVLFITLMLVLFNLTYTLLSTPAGVLSDRIGRRGVLALGWFIYGIVYLGLAAASSSWHMWLLFAGYGIYYGIAEGVARAFVADLVAEERRGTAYGLYHGVVSITALPASLIAGWLWDAVSPAAPFYLGAGLALAAMLGIIVLIKK